jgi:hypothetical protein
MVDMPMKQTTTPAESLGDGVTSPVCSPAQMVS